MRRALATTWLLVRIRPSGANTNPEPVPPPSILTTAGPITSTALITAREYESRSSVSSNFDDAKAQPSLHRFGARRHTELAEDRCEMKLHRVLADGQPRGDVAVRQAVGYEREHVMLAGGQRFKGRIGIALGGRQRQDGFRLLDEIDDLDMRVGRQPRAQRGGGPPKVNA